MNNNIEFTRERCHYEYIQLRANSDLRWNSANKLAEIGDYGGAVNSGITSLEEFIKAFILLLDSKGFEFRKVKNIETILNKSHVMRHYILYFAFLFKVIAHDAIKILVNTNFTNFNKIFLENPEIIIGKGFDFIQRKIEQMKAELPWFKSLELRRQHGVHRNVEFNMPGISNNEHNFEEIFIKLIDIREAVVELTNAFDKPEIDAEKQLIKLKEVFINENWYEKLDVEIGNLKKNRINAFTNLEKLIDKSYLFFNANTKQMFVSEFLLRESKTKHFEK